MKNPKEKSKYRAEVRVINDPKWYGNGKEFPTKEEAETYAADLFDRWMQTVAWRVVAI